MLQALHDNWGHPPYSKSLFRCIEHKTKWESLLTFSLCSIVLAARCVLYVRALEGTVAALACNYTNLTRHLRLFLPQATVSSEIPTTIQQLVS